MSGRVQLNADKTVVKLSPGSAEVVSLLVHNNGTVVDSFSLQVAGAEAEWVQLAPAQVSLFPQTQSPAVLSLHLPFNSTMPAGTYPLQVTATSRDAPGESATITVNLQIAAVQQFTARLEPQRIAGRKGTFVLQIANTGNAPHTLVIRPSDPEARLVFGAGPVGAQAFDPNAGPTLDADDDEAVAHDRPVSEELTAGSLPADWIPPTADGDQGELDLTLPIATRALIPITVTSRRRIWTGREADLPFEVMIRPPGVEWEPSAAQSVRGDLMYRPYLAAWARLPVLARQLLSFGLPWAVALLLLGLLLKPSTPAQGQTLPATPDVAGTLTAIAASAQQTALAIAAQQTATASAAQQTALASAAQTATAAAASAAAAQQTAEAAAAAQTATASAAGAAATGTAAAVAALTPPLPNVAPTIVSFGFAAAPTPAAGVQVSWVVTNAAKVLLGGTPVPLSGTRVMTITTDESLTLEASNARGSVSRSIGLLLLHSPEITSFRANASTVRAGTKVTLTWETTRATTVTLNGQVVPGPNGTLTVPVTATTEFILSAESVLGQALSRLTVTVPVTPTPGR